MSSQGRSPNRKSRESGEDGKGVRVSERGAFNESEPELTESEELESVILTERIADSRGKGGPESGCGVFANSGNGMERTESNKRNPNRANRRFARKRRTEERI